MASLYDYEAIVGKHRIQQIRQKIKTLEGKRILCVNSTYIGGGVAEMLNTMVPLLNDEGLKFEWRVLHGTPEFFTITKHFHNALQSGQLELSEEVKSTYYNTVKRWASFTHINHDLVVVHDPQPLPLIDFYDKKQPWVLRLHIDLDSPNPSLWDYLKGFIEKYDHVVVSRESFAQRVDAPYSIIHPAIDPLSPKNIELPGFRAKSVLEGFGVNPKRPLISQVMRFDKWKDPFGVLETFEKVREKTDCQLIMMGSFAPDDPEGCDIYRQVTDKVSESKYRRDIFVLKNEQGSSTNDLNVNAVQHASDVVLQLSTREGFGLTVTEAMLKQTPVVGSNVGGIPLQIINGRTGFLRQPQDYEGFAECVLKLLSDSELRAEIGRAAREHVIENFLITKLIDSWLSLVCRFLNRN
jgi:trehalose synthase